MLGHGVLLRTSDLEAAGGFPEVVSEDLALTIAFAERGRIGVAVPAALAWEAFPRSCAAYWRRLSRWISADVELVMKVLPRLWRTTLSLTAKSDLTLRELRLPVLSCGWLVSAGLALLAVLPASSPRRIPVAAWLLMLPLVVPHVAVWLPPSEPWRRRATYSVVMPFLALAGLALYPPAVVAGLRGRQTFDATGSPRTGRTRRGIVLWEWGSGAAFMGAGVSSANFVLVALGLAILLAPWLRRATRPALLIAGASAFWALVIIQITVDIASGHSEPRYLLPLVALGAATD
jgi:hypothetical protein